jgi:tetratricopeptide (TPR) repeat protein
MDDEQRLYLQDLLKAHQQRLRVLEVQAAKRGDSTPAEIITEIEDTRAKLSAINDQLDEVAVESGALGEIREPVGDFTGREDDINQLVGSLGLAVEQPQQQAICCISGMFGVGKTQLAYTVAQRAAHKFSDGQVYVDLYGMRTPVLPIQALQKVLRTFNPGRKLPEDQTKLERLYKKELRGKHVLVVADDAKDKTQVESLIPPAGCALLITSRQRFSLPGMKQLELKPLPLDEAERLLLSICPRIGCSAAHLAQLHGSLPLALRIDASNLANDDAENVERHLQELTDTSKRLQKLRDSDDPSVSVEAAFELSYDKLDEAAKDILCQLSVFPTTFDLHAAKAIVANATVTPDRVAEYLGLLRRRSLLEWHSEAERYKLHDSVRRLGAVRIKDQSSVHKRHLEHYLTMAKQAELELFGEQQAVWLERLQQEQDNLDAAIKWALELELVEKAAELTSSLWHYWRMRGHATSGSHWTEEVLKHSDVLPMILRAKVKDAAGMLALALGDYPNARASLNESLTIYQNEGDMSSIAWVYNRLGQVAIAQGEDKQAERYYKNSLKLLRKQGDKRGIAYLLNNLGSMALQRDSYPEAIKLYEESLDVSRARGDVWGKAVSLRNLAIAANYQEDFESAKIWAKESLMLYEQLKNLPGIHWCKTFLRDLGDKAKPG